MGKVFFDSANELATVSNTFDVDGVPTDPTLVNLTITAPSGVVTTPTATRTTTGVYTCDITCNEAGEWQFEWDGTGAASDTTVGTWTVLETALGRLYCTVAALKSRLGGITNSDDDLELHSACFAVSRLVEQMCDRNFYRTASEARTFAPTSWRMLHLPAFCDLVSASQVATDSSGDGVFELVWDSSQYQLLPQNPGAGPERKPYTEIWAVGGQVWPWWYPGWTGRRDRIQITGVWGWPAVPWAVRQAALILAADQFKLKDAPFGVAAEGAFLTHNTLSASQQAQALLKPYRRDAVLIG